MFILSVTQNEVSIKYKIIDIKVGSSVAELLVAQAQKQYPCPY